MDGRLYAAGGVGPGLAPLATVAEYNPLADRWHEQLPMPSVRWGLGVAVAGNGKLYAVGGADSTYGSTPVNYLATAEEATLPLAVQYYLSDGLGSTLGLVDAMGVPTASYRYDVFGALRQVAGPSSTDFRFTGEQFDDTAKLQYLRARWYDPALGRFLSRDSFGGWRTDPQTLNRYGYVVGNPVNHVDPTGLAAEDLQYLVPAWYDRPWHDAFVRTIGHEPQAVDYVQRYMTMGLANHLSREEIARNLTVAIGAGLSPSGPGLWSQPVDQTDITRERAQWGRAFPSDHSGWVRSPQEKDSALFGPGYQEMLWGRIRIVFSDQGELGSLTRLLGGGDNATTYSCNLIVFTRPLDFNRPEDMWWLMHELRHVMQAQFLGAAYLPMYVADLQWMHGGHPMERNANAFANAAGYGVPLCQDSSGASIC